MEIVKPSYELVSWTPEPEKLIARMARICYQTDKGNDANLIRLLIRRGHTSQIEHASASVIFTIDRGISHEVVRSRVGVAYSQESTRYCSYKNGIRVIQPLRKLSAKAQAIWEKSVLVCEQGYNDLMAEGCTPQEARDVLPTCLRTQLGITMDFRAWRWFLALRHAKEAHPKIRHAAFHVWKQLSPIAPSVFKTCPTVAEVEIDMDAAYGEWQKALGETSF